MIRVVLPAHLRTLGRISGDEVSLEVPGPVTQRTVLDALEARYPMLQGTLRDHVTQERRAFVRFFALEQDLSHESPDAPLPDAVASGKEPFLVVGAIAGGSGAHAECLRIADQLLRAFNGDAWHGPPLMKTLSDVTADEAVLRPLASGHTIWELVLHIELWTRVALEATKGIPMPKLYGTEEDWTTAPKGSADDWSQATARMLTTAEKLAEAVTAFGDWRLEDTVPGREYDFYYLFHGIVQHSLYHCGQIAMLRREALDNRPA